MAFTSVNKSALQLAFLVVTVMLLVAHARDISSSDRRVDVVIKKGGVVQDAVVEKSSSSSSSNAFETEQHQKNLTGSTAQEEAADDLWAMDYTPARKKSPIHN